MAKEKENKIKIEPLQDRVLVREEDDSKERKTSAGIIIPVGTNEDKSNKKGEVIAVGPGRTEDGKLIPVNIKVGSMVLFQWGEKIKVGDEEYYLVREGEILAVIK